ncbi:MAG: chitosanase [Anaerolineaceae bacterium]|nr:MAG: chitosanase [Anaerolineaceae bacterium]
MPNPYTGPFEPDKWRPAIWAITSIFESGRPEGNPAMYQNYDSGIVSYGRHQATLASGSLSLVLDEFYARSQSAASRTLRQGFDGRVKTKDEALRNDNDFKALLIQAAAEQEMTDAQDAVFDRFYYQPAISKVQQCHLASPLGLAVAYDTRIQGGWLQVLNRLAARLGGSVVGQNGIEEDRWIAVYLEEREAWLYEIAQRAENNGDPSSANALRISTFRVRELKTLAAAGNYALAGPFTVRGWNLPGIPAAPKPVAAPPKPVADAQLLDANAVEDLLVLRPGQTFTVTWSLRNSGTLAWEAGFRLANTSNIPVRRGPPREFPLENVSAHMPVAPGADVNLSVSLRAPRTGRHHRSEWRLVDSGGNFFGAVLLLEFYIRKPPYPV